MRNIPGRLLLLCCCLQACAAPRGLAPGTTSLRIKGSDTMIMLVQRWAEEFMLRHPGLAIYVEGGGSAAGIAALIKGEADISAASRPLRAIEARQLAARQHTIGVASLVAKDGLSIYLNPANPVRNLSLAQVRDIYLGRIKSWREVGGRDVPITALSRSPNSGTYLYFQEHVLEGQAYGHHVISLPTTAAIVAAVAEDSTAIGYGGIAHGRQLVHCSINGITPTIEAVRRDLYPITRYLYLYTVQKPQGTAKLFIDWVLSKEGQRLVQEMDYVPLFEVP
ncbi:MAG: phosphate ABC transporter substrate-binding protein [candidate division KSB1 bacterium]|nr:phosphate ABC transporter substrate-binding protein [candidate division KSB1 bacterium]MDZ7288123.1 phosphate ABC transporter substrate-binding protein [candidate division KSB1 bacterium]MDZ7300224.1 phosphate ABC transporter substrate-binding protein [candidate division KSB1 bacterium]MDZ7309131.1 phosphate ABC transporter substrate-binding protein [candidate division KSB1 bacterium]MDZ7351224.1 phosphate ABC transporter substrate-binding protein [candidate division KSB1 bacterium]